MPETSQMYPIGEKPYLAMVIEDDIISKNAIVMQLIAIGFRVVEVSTLSGAYDLLKDTTPDVIFLDRELFSHSGTELLKKRQNDDHLAKIRIIMTTGEKSMTAITESLKLGADDYLIKPLDLKLLTHSLTKLGFQLKESLLFKPTQGSGTNGV